ncbi:hypothetical protein [Cellulomonas triticagri]|uniref:Uncharacterized protein n=1 Tax=Cellulomonas triticagri TaxID=2483352 RepID=A0A3M2J477_9CELL|nr:hypothetical protein [Cellulomonas triticagri]RMI06891.1 hypothetical protein EBM89_14745 [Cellulomonas triticagri]
MTSGTPRTTATRRTGARGPLPAVPTAVLAALTLVVAFAVAQGTGVRALGGVVLVAGVVWCGWRALPASGVLRVGAVVALGAVCFVASHLLAGALGAWPSVLLVAAVLAVGTWVLVDRRPSRTGPPRAGSS